MKFLKYFFGFAFIIILCSSCSNKEENVIELSGDDSLVYDLVYQASYNFKNPSSVRLISGSVVAEQAFVRLSATNGFGATTTGYYWIVLNDDGTTLCTELEKDSSILILVGVSKENFEYMISFCEDRESLNINTINQKLAENWS